jgi:phosphoribosylamine--glycine ligase
LPQACGQIVIEERLVGEELSWMAFCDGSRCALLEPARDFKRARDGDQGPNTGGMGAFSPVPGIPPSLAERVRAQVFEPVLREMKNRGTPFSGLLYAGLMVNLAREQLWVIEFNARFGDPETQVLMARFDDDLFAWMNAVAQGDLSKLPGNVPFKKDAAVVVVGAAAGYPENPKKGDPIEIQEGPSIGAAQVPPFFFAGVVRKDGALQTAGGRVLGAMGMGAAVENARAQAYERIGHVRWNGLQYRRDIAQ